VFADQALAFPQSRSPIIRVRVHGAATAFRSLRARLPNDSLPGRRRTPGVRAGRRACRRRPRQRRVWALQRVNTRVRTSGAHERAGSVRALVWTRVAGVRRAHHTAHRVQPRVRVQGIYRGECDASGRVGQAFAGRRHSKICPRAAEPRRNGDDPAAAHAHERLARLHPIARMAGPRGARPRFGSRCAQRAGASARAEFRARDCVCVQQHRVLSLGARGAAGVGGVAAAICARTHLRAARHAGHAIRG